MENERGYFEQFLRERTDQFELVAGRKIWTSIYNNIHPSRKWPSVSVCLFMLAFLFLIGHLNAPELVAPETAKHPLFFAENIKATATSENKIGANDLSTEDTKALAEKSGLYRPKDGSSTNKSVHNPIASSRTGTPVKNQHLAPRKPNTYPNPYRTTIQNESIMGVNSAATATKKIEKSVTRTASAGVSKLQAVQIFERNESLVRYIAPQHRTEADNPTSPAPKTWVEQATGQQIRNPGPEPHEGAARENNNSDFNNNGQHAASLKSNMTAQASISLSQEASRLQKDWMEHDIQYNRRKVRPWKGKLEWQAHIASGISYRTLRDNTPDKVHAAEVAAGNDPEQSLSLNNAVRQKPSFGIEAGYQLKYPLLKNIRVKLGAQFNYQQYTIDAFENHHPIGTSLLLSDEETGDVMNVYKTTSLSNLNGVDAVRLHNNSFQFSIPIGLDARIAGNESVQWFAGASIQPAFVISARNFLLSADKRYYVKDNSLLNKAGLYASIETYLSFSRGNYSWQLGPQFRANLLSTNTRLYNVMEHINGLGLKAGVTKKF